MHVHCANALHYVQMQLYYVQIKILFSSVDKWLKTNKDMFREVHRYDIFILHFCQIKYPILAILKSLPCISLQYNMLWGCGFSPKVNIFSKFAGRAINFSNQKISMKLSNTLAYVLLIWISNIGNRHERIFWHEDGNGQ